jgi:hypothetical protein
LLVSEIMNLRVVVLVSSLACSAPLPTTMTTDAYQGACKEVVVQCAYGGFHGAGHDPGHDMIVDCLHPLESGKTVRGVALSTSTVVGCFGADLNDAEGRRFAEEMGSHVIGIDPR